MLVYIYMSMLIYIYAYICLCLYIYICPCLCLYMSMSCTTHHLTTNQLQKQNSFAKKRKYWSSFSSNHSNFILQYVLFFPAACIITRFNTVSSKITTNKTHSSLISFHLLWFVRFIIHWAFVWLIHVLSNHRCCFYSVGSVGSIGSLAQLLEIIMVPWVEWLIRGIIPIQTIFKKSTFPFV